MLVAAINWDPTRPSLSVEEVLEHDTNRQYVESWQRPGDFGVIATDDDGAAVGAAWCRLFTSTERGYGYVGDHIPEISIGVVEDRRGQGVGTLLLAELEGAARARGVCALSLSVESANPARRLYERRGYRRVNVSGDSETMRLEL